MLSLRTQISDEPSHVMYRKVVDEESTSASQVFGQMAISRKVYVVNSDERIFDRFKNNDIRRYIHILSLIASV